MSDLKQALRDFVTTSNSGKYATEEELMSKFPELQGYDIQVLRDFVTTSNSGKYADEETLFSKFPEFGIGQQPKKKEDGGLLQEAQRTIQQYSQSLSPSQESESQQLSPSVSSLVEPYKEQKVKKLSPVGTTIPAIDYTTMQEDLSWQDKTGVSQSSINQNKIESEEKAKELAILEEKRRKKEAADDITRAREMFARRAEEEKIRLENEKLNLDYRTKDLNFLSNLNSVTSDLISTTKENVVQKLNEKFKGNGIVFEEAGWGTNRIIARTEDGKSVINIGSYNFLDSANTSEAEKLRNFISKNAKRTEDIGDRDFLSNSLKAQNLRAVPMIENGEPSTVRFTSFEENGKFLVIPTLFPKDPNKYTTNPSTWMELPFEQARKVAMERGEVFTFKTQKEADDFAKGSWKDVNTIDIEGDSFFKALGKDYMTEKKRYERFTELDDIIDFAEKVYKYEGTSMTEQELQKKYPKYFISGKARFDLEKMLPEMKKERDALKPLVKDYTFFNQEGTSEDARMMWDKYLQDRNNQISSQAAAVRRDADIQEMNLDKKSYEKFGVSIKDLKNYAVTNPSQKKEYDQLINQYVDAQDKKVIASEYMQEAKLYFDAKDNKNIMQEFSENFSGVVNSTLDAYRENAGGAALLNFAIGLKNAHKIKDVKEASEYIKNLRESMSGTQSKELTRFQNVSDFSELIDVISDDPISVITSLVGSSFATQLPVGTKIIPATVLTSTAYGGATAGLPGAVGGFFSGLSTGQAITEFATEYNTALIDAIKKRGYDMEDPYSLQKALLNKEVWDEALEIGVTRGIPMAIMEKVTGGLSGRVFVPSSRLATTASKLKGYALESAVIDPTSEMLGELAAQGAMVATGKQDKIQYTELYGEFLGGLGAKSMTNGASTLYKIVRDHNNINLAYDLTDVANIAKENVSDERIMSWADNMVRLGKIDNTVAHRIRENVGLKREAKELMSVGEKPSNEVVARTMELMAAKQELTKTKNRSEVYRDKISEIDEELANMASTKKVADKDNQTSLVGITEAVRPSVAEYTINNRRYTKERFLDKINSMSPGRISRNDVKVVGDEEIVNLLNKKTNAVQEQTAGQVSVQPTTGVSQEVAQGESQAEPQVATQEVVKTKEVVTAPKATVDIFNSTPNETKANITFVSTDGNEVALQDNESEAASLYDEAVSIPLQQRTEEQVSLIEKLQPVVDQFKATEVTPAAETKTPDQEADLLEELVSGKKTTPTETTETKVEFTEQDRNRKRELEDGLKYSDKRRKTVLIGGVTMTRSEANAELDALKQKETTSIESEVASIEKLFSEKKDDGNKQKVLEQVNRAIKAVRSILPKTKVVVHDTNEAYESATGDAGGSSGIFIPSKDGGTIHINLSKSNTRTVAHEVFHAVLLRGIKTDAEAKRLADAMIKAVRKSLEQSSDKKTLEEFNKFVNQYDQDIQNEEYLAEVFGYLAENFKQLPKPAQGIISKFLERIAKLFGIKPMTDSEVIDFMNTISRKVSTGEDITESDINAFTQMKEGLESQGGSGFVGTFSIPRRKIDYEIIQATSAKDDSRDWVKNLVQDVDIREFDGQSFITNMYDYTNAGVTDLGNGITLNLFGGKNYVPYMMSLRGLKIGDLSNLAAFNTKANAEGFIRNARESGATLFSPHAGTKNQSWQFQHAIFEELVKAVLNNNVLTGKELIQIFNQGLINKKGNYIPPFAQFRKKYGNISDFSEFENNPLGLVELLNIENNYSPNLRKRLVDLLVADKKFQKKIGIKNKGQFYERIEDPLNKGVVGGELMGIVKFDPNTFKIRKTKPGDIDHHPSFGWTLEANIEGIYQPTEFYKSYDVTDSYTKYNKKEVVVSKKGESTVKNFIKSNVSSSAGALPKVATFENLSPRKQKVKKDESLKENSIFEEQKNKKDEIQSERERDGRGRTEGRTIAPLEGTPTVQGFSGPDAQLTSVAEEYAKENGIPYKRQGEYVKVDENRAKRIAQAYEEMKHDPQNPKVKEAYENLIKQTIAQYEALVKAGYKFWFIDTNIPSNLKYAESPYNAMRDIRNNKEMGVFPTTDGFGSSDIDVSDNPLMAETKFKWPVGGMDGELKPVLANDLFRAVHDAFGHGLEGAGFRARGEENAWQAHIRLFTGSAIGAITSETRGQNSWLNFGPYGEKNRTANTEDTIFATQKTGLMPEWTWKEGVAGDMEDKANQEVDKIEQLPSARKQKSSNLQEIIKQARANGISEAGIRAYFKKNGLTDIEIDKLLETTEVAKGKIELSEETLPGYTKLMNRIKDVIKRSRSRGLSEDQIMENVIANVESRSPEYANATDQQREQIIRDIRKMFGKKEKAAPSAKKILGINFSNKLTIEERVLRDLQIKSEIRGAKNVVAKMKLMKQYINSVVRDWSKGVKGKVSLAQMKNIISKLNKTNLLDDGSINKFIDYMFNVINDAEYGNKLSQANSNINEIKTKIKNLKEIKSPILKELAKQFSKLDPSLVEDIDLFNSIANRILDNLSKNTVDDVINYQDLSLWLSENRYKQEEIKKARLVPIIEEITGQDAKDLTYDQMIEILEALKEKSTEKDETEIREKLYEAFKNAVTAYQFDEKNPIVDRFINIDLSKLSVSEIVEVVYALANYIENKDTAKMETIISMYEGNQSAEAASKMNLKTSKFRAFSRFMNEQFASLPIVFEKLFNGVKKGMKVMSLMGIDRLINASNEAKNIFNGIVNEYVSKFYSQNPNSQEFNTLYNNVERGMLAALLRSPVGNLDAIKKDFERNRGLILDAIDKLRMGDANQVKIAQIYQQVYDKILKDSKDASEVLSKVDPINAEAVNWWINQWGEVYDEMYDVSLNVYNKQLDKDYNYTSSKFSFINLQEDIIEDDMSSYDYATGSSKMYEKMAGNLMKAIKPTSRNLNKGLYLDLNFDTVNANAMSSVLMDIKTAASIKRVKGFVESKYFASVIPDANMRAVVTKRINEYIKNIRKKRPYDSDEFNKVINLLDTIAKYSTSQALGGVTQPAKQVIPAILNTFAQTGNLSFIGKAFNSDVHNFLNNSGYGISNRGVESAAQLESINKMIEIAAQSPASKVIKKIGDINDLMLKTLLVKPDIFVARASWLAYYEQYMKKNNKGEKIDYATHKINKDAADYAETMTSRQLNLNDADLAGSFFLSNDTGKKWIRNTLLPFANFRINQYLRTSSDVARIVNFKTTSFEDRVIAIRSLVGTMSEMAMYKLIAAGIGLGLTGLAMAIRGDDDEEEWERAYSNAIKGGATSAVTDLFSPLPLTDQFVRGGVGEFLDLAQSLNDVPVEDRWNIFTKDELDVLDTYGKLGIPLKRAFEIKDGAELVLTGKFEDKYGNVKYITDQDREILLYGVLGGAFVNVFGLGVGPEYNNTYNKIVKQAKRDAQTEKQIEKKIMLGDWETKEDMKRYAPEEYEKKFGKGGVYYEESKSDSEEKKAEREEERKNKDEMYGYKEKPKKSSSKGVMNSKGIMGGKGVSRKGIMGSKGISK